MKFVKEEHRFTSDGLRCHAWLYRPQIDGDYPIIVMAHGVAAEKTFALPKFAERFVEQGWAVLLFDYRNLGQSEGEPRNWVSHWRHGKDWDNAIAYVRTLEHIDKERLVLWGSSFGGAHVISAAARHSGIKAIVAQVPFVDNIATTKTIGFSHIAKSMLYGVYDLLLYRLTGKSFYVPAVGKPDSFAAMNTPESYQGYMSIVPKGSEWKNQIPARFFLSIGMFSPLRQAHKVRCPSLIIAGKYDSLSPVSAVAKTAASITQGEYIEMACNHFEPYSGEYFEQNIQHQLAFLTRQLVN